MIQSKLLKILHIINDHHHHLHDGRSLWIKSILISIVGNSLWEIIYPDLIHMLMRFISLIGGAFILRLTFLLLDKFMPLKSKSNESSPSEKNQHKD
jgi:hypothetical protein